MIDNNDEVENYINSLVYLCNKLCDDYQSIVNNTQINNTIKVECNNLLSTKVVPNNELSYIIIYISIISMLLSLITCMFKCYHNIIKI